MDHTLQQPDFFDAARGLRAAADNLELCQNIPGVEDGQRYIQTMERLMTRLNEIQEEQRQGFSRFQSALEALVRENGARDRNRHIALENSVIVDGNGQLEPLYSLTTGQIIVNFPSRVAEVNRLAVPEANRILNELKLDENGDIRMKRRRLLIACGVRHMAV